MEVQIAGGHRTDHAVLHLGQIVLQVQLSMSLRFRAFL